MKMVEKFANQIGYSDVKPFEIIKVISDGCVEVRAMEAKRANPDADMGFCPGGFVGNFAAQDKQEWDIQPDAAGYVVRIRKSKAARKAGQWFDKNGGRYVVGAAPRKFYDYNF